MKTTLVFALLFAFSNGLGSIAGAANSDILSAKILRAFPDRSLEYADHVLGGSIAIDRESAKVRLRIELKPSCPSNRICIQSLPQPVIEELPLVSVSSDTCGTVIYRARRDENEIIVRDHSANRCPTVLVLPETEVVHTSLKEGAIRSVYDADRLTPNDL